MPYIEQHKRLSFKPIIDLAHNHFNFGGVTPGDLNYLITKLTHLYMEHKGLSYTHLNDVVGVLESAKAEFQRQKVAPYEDGQIKKNGDL